MTDKTILNRRARRERGGSLGVSARSAVNPASRLAAALTLSLSLSLLSPNRALAQTGTPPADDTSPSGERTGTVAGQITNGTGGGVPGGLAVMLHAWDTEGETVMLDGQADSTGSFRFDDVPMQDGWVFAAMLSYGDVTYFSDAGEVGPDTTEIALPLTMYESTPDTSAIQVAQMHAFLDFTPGEVTVGEIYILSNTGDRAVVGGLTLADGQAATLQFTLPPGANKVRFEDDSSRLVITPDGFADIGAVPPGEQAAQVMVSYSLPYSSGMTFAHAVNYPVGAANVLMRADSNVRLTGEGLGGPVPRQMSTGETYNIYAAGPLAPGDTLRLTLTGKPSYRVAEDTMVASSPSTLNTFANRWAIPLAGGILGAALVTLGVWWWRRNATTEEEAATESDPEAEWPNVLRAIAELDEAHERGEMGEDDYRARRAELQAKARAILLAREASK